MRKSSKKTTMIKRTLLRVLNYLKPRFHLNHVRNIPHLVTTSSDQTDISQVQIQLDCVK